MFSVARCKKGKPTNMKLQSLSQNGTSAHHLWDSHKGASENVLPQLINYDKCLKSAKRRSMIDQMHAFSRAAASYRSAVARRMTTAELLTAEPLRLLAIHGTVLAIRGGRGSTRGVWMSEIALQRWVSGGRCLGERDRKRAPRSACGRHRSGSMRIFP